jgi:hypothetical protein
MVLLLERSALEPTKFEEGDISRRPSHKTCVCVQKAKFQPSVEKAIVLPCESFSVTDWLGHIVALCAVDSFPYVCNASRLYAALSSHYGLQRSSNVLRILVDPSHMSSSSVNDLIAVRWKSNAS